MNASTGVSIKLQAFEMEKIIPTAVGMLRGRIAGELRPLIDLSFDCKHDDSKGVIHAFEQEFLVRQQVREGGNNSNGNNNTSVQTEDVNLGQVISVQRAVHDAIGGVLENTRPHIGKYRIAEDELMRLYVDTVDAFNEGFDDTVQFVPDKKVLDCVSQYQLDNQQVMVGLSNEISEDGYECMFDPPEGGLEGFIDELHDKIKAYHAIWGDYNLAESFYDTEGLSMADDDNGENSDFNLRTDFSAGGDKNTGGLINDYPSNSEVEDEPETPSGLDGEHFIEENIPYSPAEKFFHDLLPPELLENSDLMVTQYTWYVDGDTEEEVGLKVIEDHPGAYEEYLNIFLQRKILTYIFGCLKVHPQLREETKEEAEKRKEMSDILKREIHDLRDERNDLFGDDREELFVDGVQDEDDSEGTPISYEGIVQNIHNAIDHRDKALESFFLYPDRMQVHHTAIMEQSDALRENITSLCFAYPGRSLALYFSETSSESTASGTTDKPILTPEFIARMATHRDLSLAWTVVASEAEETVRDLLSEVDFLPLQHLPKQSQDVLFTFSPDNSRQPYYERVRLVVSNVKRVYLEKLHLYWLFSNYLREKPDDTMNAALQEFRHELEDWCQAIKTLESRLNEVNDQGNKIRNNENEITSWHNMRLRDLRRFFHESDIHTQNQLAQGILFRTEMLGICYTKRAYLNSRDHGFNYDTLPTLGKSYPEVHLSRYIPRFVMNNNNEVFSATWEYVIYPRMSFSDGFKMSDINTLSKKKALERMYLVYFYSSRRMSDIVVELESGEPFSDTDVLSEEYQTIKAFLATLRENIISAEEPTQEKGKANPAHIATMSKNYHPANALVPIMEHLEGLLVGLDGFSHPELVLIIHEVLKILGHIRTETLGITDFNVVIGRIRESSNAIEEMITQRMKTPGLLRRGRPANHSIEEFILELGSVLDRIDEISETYREPQEIKPSPAEESGLLQD